MTKLRLASRPVQRATASLERDLTRLADGTLNASERRRVEQRVAGSAELQARLREQRKAVAATRSLHSLERAPLSLRMEHRAFAARERRRVPLLGVGLAAVAAALVWTFVVLSGEPTALTVARAATIATRPATAPVAEPEPAGEQKTLPGVRGGGLPFPYWEDTFGWLATGTRTDRMDGRSLTTVFYRRGTQRIAYTIVGGGALPPAEGTDTSVRAGTTLTSSISGGRLLVTWMRGGHTCVLSGAGVPLAALLRLATWRGNRA